MATLTATLRATYLQACESIGKDTVDARVCSLLRRLLRQASESAKVKIPVTAIAEEVIADLNRRTLLEYKPSRQSTIRHIRARLADGMNIDDFVLVNEWAVATWTNDPLRKDYIRPQTLYGEKMEGYVQAARKWKPEQKALTQVDHEREEYEAKRKPWHMFATWIDLWRYMNGMTPEQLSAYNCPRVFRHWLVEYVPNATTKEEKTRIQEMYIAIKSSEGV